MRLIDFTILVLCGQLKFSASFVQLNRLFTAQRLLAKGTSGAEMQPIVHLKFDMGLCIEGGQK